MATITPEAQQLVNRGHLGNVTAVYGPGTVGSIIGSLFLMAFGLAWFLVVGTLLGSSFVPSGLIPIPSQALMQPSPSDDTVFSIFKIVFPLFGLLFVMIALFLIARAISNRNSRVAICTYGLAYITTKIADTIRWEQILTVTHKMDVNRNTTYNQSTGMSTTTTSVRHRYTIHCHDGRKFVLDSNLLGRKVQKLAEIIEVQRARYQRQAPGAPGMRY